MMNRPNHKCCVTLGLAMALLAVTSAGVAASPAIRSVRLDRPRVAVFERLTLDVDLTAEYDNPFDPEQIALDAEVTDPAGRTSTTPGFLYQPFRRDDTATHSRRTVATGKPRWQLRLSFTRPGVHRIIVRLCDRSGQVRSEPYSVQVQAADTPGLIRRSDRDHRYFVTDRRESWFAVGANVCWGETWSDQGRRIFVYDEWFGRYAEAGCNFARLWLSPGWNDLCLVTRESGYDRIDLQRAWHLDYVLELAEKHDLRLMLCIDSFNVLRSTQRLYGDWENSPLHPDHGGPVTRPREFFTSEPMRRAYRSRLRYLVARYGYSPHVLAWEFFNEVDIVDEYDSAAVTAWHRDMARHLRAIDPHDHLITTSFAHPPGDPAVDALEELDFVQTHHYEARDIAAMMERDLRAKAAARIKPHFHGEFGISHSGQETAKMDPTGVHLHNGLYASVGQGHAGVPMTWWWDSYVHPQNLYPLYAAFVRWIDGFDFVAQEPRAARVRFEWTDASDKQVPLRAWGLLGRSRGLLWVQNPWHTWPQATAADGRPQPVTDARLVVQEVPAGDWIVETWDTHKGTVLATRGLTVGADGLLRIDLPAVAWDAAFRLARRAD